MQGARARCGNAARGRAARARATHVRGGDAEGLGDGLVQLLHVGKVADLAGRGAVRELDMENHIKLLGGGRAAGGRLWECSFLWHDWLCVGAFEWWWWWWWVEQQQ